MRESGRAPCCGDLQRRRRAESFLAGYKTRQRSIPLVRPLLLAVSAPILWSPSLLRETARGRITNWWTEYESERGMARWHDLVDRVGGYPFEVASPDKIIAFCESRGYRLKRLITTTRLGCNQFSFRSAPVCDEATSAGAGK